MRLHTGARGRRVPLAPSLYDETWVQWFLRGVWFSTPAQGSLSMGSSPFCMRLHRGVQECLSMGSSPVSRRLHRGDRLTRYICCAVSVSGAALANPGASHLHHVGRNREPRHTMLVRVFENRSLPTAPCWSQAGALSSMLVESL